MSIPRLTGAFEIFVPGAFLFLNIIGVGWAFDWGRSGWDEVGISPVVLALVVITFGYLLGVILRLLKSEVPDVLSGKFMALLHWGHVRCHRLVKCNWSPLPSLLCDDRFPYPKTLRARCHQLPGEVLAFHDRVWGRASKHYFNFSKSLISAEDSTASVQFQSLEAMCRFITGMFYALLFSCVLIGMALAGGSGGDLRSVAWMTFWLYAACIVAILWNLRVHRYREVEAVFHATYRNRSFIEQRVPSLGG